MASDSRRTVLISKQTHVSTVCQAFRKRVPACPNSVSNLSLWKWWGKKMWRWWSRAKLHMLARRVLRMQRFLQLDEHRCQSLERSALAHERACRYERCRRQFTSRRIIWIRTRQRSSRPSKTLPAQLKKGQHPRTTAPPTTKLAFVDVFSGFVRPPPHFFFFLGEFL